MHVHEQQERPQEKYELAILLNYKVEGERREKREERR